MNRTCPEDVAQRVLLPKISCVADPSKVAVVEDPATQRKPTYLLQCLMTVRQWDLASQKPELLKSKVCVVGHNIVSLMCSFRWIGYG